LSRSPVLGAPYASLKLGVFARWKESLRKNAR